MKAGVEIRDRTYHLKTYKQCFLGTEAVAWLTSQDIVSVSGWAERGAGSWHAGNGSPSHDTLHFATGGWCWGCRASKMPCVWATCWCRLVSSST